MALVAMAIHVILCAKLLPSRMLISTLPIRAHNSGQVENMRADFYAGALR